jgi:hypothetical protein
MLHQALEITSKRFTYNFISTQKKIYFPEDMHVYKRCRVQFCNWVGLIKGWREYNGYDRKFGFVTDLPRQFLTSSLRTAAYYLVCAMNEELWVHETLSPNGRVLCLILHRTTNVEVSAILLKSHTHNGYFVFKCIVRIDLKKWITYKQW